MPLILVVSVAAMSGGVERAGAACIGLYIAYAPSEVALGSDIDVVGLAWGDNCYDTGPPPAGEGPLGRPAVWHFSITGTAPVQSSTSIAAVGTSDPVAPGGSTDPVEPAESRNGAVVSDESARGWSTGAKVLLIAVLAVAVAVLAIPGFMRSPSQRA